MLLRVWLGVFSVGFRTLYDDLGCVASSLKQNCMISISCHSSRDADRNTTPVLSYIRQVIAQNNKIQFKCLLDSHVRIKPLVHFIQNHGIHLTSAPASHP